MANVRQLFFPYGMAKNADGSWTFFNRRYKPVGVVSDDYAEWDDPKHKIKVKGLGPATLAKLDHEGKGIGDRIYFYDDGCIPTTSEADMKAYLAKLRIIINLQEG